MSLDVRDDPDESRYLLEVDGEQAGLLEYVRRGDTVLLVHTEVDPERREDGLGGELVRHVLDDLRAQGVRVDPRCPFAAAWIDEHPEYQDLVAD